SHLNQVSQQHADYEFPASECAKGKIRGCNTNGRACGGPETYTTTHGIWGTVTYCLAWHQQEHEHDCSFAPSKDLVQLCSVQQCAQRDLFFTSIHDIHCKLNHIIELVNPDLYARLQDLRTGLQDHPSCFRYLPFWASIFPGHSFICNRKNGSHIDGNDIQCGFEAILAGGRFTGGHLRLDDLDVRLRLSLGTLLLLDGTSLQHSVEPWSGPQQFSHTLFAHRSLFLELKIPYSLPDVSLCAIKARLATPTYQPAPSQSPVKKQLLEVGPESSSKHRRKD
ncbi:hypothetical protein FRC08_001166, partial [Ceratobasidium sp. 394]